MALIKCPECGKDISDKSKSCIHCGFPLDEYTHEPVDSIPLVSNDAVSPPVEENIAPITFVETPKTAEPESSIESNTSTVLNFSLKHIIIAVSLLFALMLCLYLCASGSNNVPENEDPNTTEITNPQTEQTQPKEMTVMDAERIGEEYLDSAFGRMRFLSSVKNSVKNADSFTSFSINKCTTEQDGRYYYCTFKGTFYAKDEYGKNLGQYRFTWTAKISMDDWDACMSDDISISK